MSRYETVSAVTLASADPCPTAPGVCPLVDPQPLSPAYGLSLIRLGSDADGMAAWPGLLLHSRTLTWPFDPQARPLDDVAAVQGHAAAAGLHRVDDPFVVQLPAAAGWTFHLPGLNPARLSTPFGVVELTRNPHISESWWSLAVAHGARCRLLVAACVAMPADPARQSFAAHILTEGAVDGRVAGATIAVEFFETKCSTELNTAG